MTNAIIPMLRLNQTLRVLHIPNTKLPIEFTCQLLNAIGIHPTLKTVTLRLSRLGYILEPELRRLEREILSMAQAPTELETLILEPFYSTTMAISENDLRVKKEIIRNLEQQLPHLQHLKI